MRGFWNKTREVTAAAVEKAKGFFASGESRSVDYTSGRARFDASLRRALAAAPIAKMSGGMDDSAGCNTIKAGYAMGQPYLSDELLGWFMNQGFIGHQVAAFVATHWLVDKACSMPARDAIRQGYTIVSDDGGELPPEIVHRMKKADERFGLMAHMREFVTMGRVFGIRVALFKVESTDPEYYSKPFNPDGVTPNSYRGIVQIDPYWIAPELDTASAADPASLHFYEPTWWNIDGKRYHRSHLVIFRNGDVPDILKPVYLYGGVPVPQRILERVYCGERTANEAPQLAMTKRTTAFATDAAAAFADQAKFNERLADWVNYRDNYAVKVLDKESDELQQFDTSLTDLDAVIMSQYQLVAAAAGVPATKLLGTTPKGFNATGEYDEANYHEELESIQTHDLTPLVERHHLLVMRSIIAPTLSDKKPVATSVVWEALDSPTAQEYAETQKAEAERDKALVEVGAIDAVDVRNRLRSDRNSGYHGIEEGIRDLPVGSPAEEGTGVNQPGTVAADSLDSVQIVSNQRFIDPTIVAEKLAARDFTVQVTPIFVGADGARFRIIVDGHHSLAAARQAGVAPTFIEGDYAGSDYQAMAEA